MSRFIDADKLHEEIFEETKFKRDPEINDAVKRLTMPISEVLRRINNQPSVDVIEVGKAYPKEVFEKYGWSEWIDEEGQRWVMIERRDDE